MDREEIGRKMGEIITRTWVDEAFKQRLLSDATAVLKEEGIEIPAGLQVRVFENTDTVYNIALPPKPSRELSGDTLDSVAGGNACGYCGGFDEILHPSNWNWGSPGGGMI